MTRSRAGCRGRRTPAPVWDWPEKLPPSMVDEYRAGLALWTEYTAGGFPEFLRRIEAAPPDDVLRLLVTAGVASRMDGSMGDVAAWFERPLEAP